MFAFGHGLSYSKFEYSQLKINAHKKAKKGGVLATATVTVSNEGDRDGAEIPQAYIGFPESAGEPPKLLRGFEKVFLKKGKKAKVTFEFTEMDLSTFDPESQQWNVASGDFTVYVGASSRDIRQTGTFTL